MRLQYDNQHRLASITDALGQSTEFRYDNAVRPLLITGVTDPFGRSVEIGYDANGRLDGITDAQGLTTNFTYDNGTLITAMTTPYGTTSFSAGQSGTTRWVQITDPRGERERVEYRHGASGIPFSDSPVPSGMTLFNQYISSRNTFYWDKEAMKRAAGNYTQARIRHWFHLRTNTSVTAGVMESQKNPLERRVWFNYPGQSSAGREGTLDKPSKIGRVLPDGTTQLKQFSYNSRGNITAEIDPEGREIRYEYASNGIDIERVLRKAASGFETLAEFTYNDQHRPLTYTDPDGQVTVHTYTAEGQPLTVTNPLGQNTTFVYDGQGYLEGITDASGVRQVSYTYDQIGRKASETNAAGYRLDYSYDDLNRVTEVRYPDGTADIYGWDKLDRVSIPDRHGNTTQHTFDEVRNLIRTEDASGHETSYSYFADGSLKTNTDGNNHTTSYERDIQNRVVRAIRPDTQFSQITYDNSGRQSTLTDPLGGVTTFGYGRDGKLTSVTDPKGVVTRYGYHPYTGHLSEQSSPDSGNTNYDHDADGNLIRKQDANGNITRLHHDPLNRVERVEYSDGQAVPLAITGALLGLVLFGATLNIYSQISAIMLIGLAAKNGMLIVEFSNQLRDRGVEFSQAIILAATTRLRPVLMTSNCTAFGAIPLMLATGAGELARQSIGAVVFFGVTVSVLLTLVVVPCVYALVARNTHSPQHLSQMIDRLQGFQK